MTYPIFTQDVPMITLYHCVSARSFRPLWVLEEMGLPYQLKMLPFPPRALAREFLQENPMGTVPLLVDGDTRMTESAAMCQRITARARRMERPTNRWTWQSTTPPMAPT
jgi:glutathione S-transferase